MTGVLISPVAISSADSRPVELGLLIENVRFGIGFFRLSVIDIVLVIVVVGTDLALNVYVSLESTMRVQ